MTVYVVTHESTRTEFTTFQAADNFAVEVGGQVAEEQKSEPQSPVPEEVTPRQIRQALILSGVSIEQIEAALESLSEPTKSLAKTEWEYSIAFQRSRPLVAQVGLMLGWTSEQLDDLWRFAASL
jgi:hypothetical protein